MKLDVHWEQMAECTLLEGTLTRHQEEPTMNRQGLVFHTEHKFVPSNLEWLRDTILNRIYNLRLYLPIPCRELLEEDVCAQTGSSTGSLDGIEYQWRGIYTYRYGGVRL